MPEAKRSKLSGLVAALAASALLAGCATAPAPSQVERLQHQFLAMLPVGEVLAYIAAREPNWPLQTNASQFTKENIACMRRELTREKGDALMRQRAAEYAQKNPERVPDALALLDSGVVNFLGKSMRAGMFGETVPKPSSQEVKATVEFVTAPRYADLREAMYMDGFADAMFDPAAGYREGQKVGLRFMLPLILDAAAVCGLDPVNGGKPGAVNRKAPS